MPEPRILNAAEALREAMDLALARWPEVYLLGEGVADPKGIFGTTVGLVEKYGPDYRAADVIADLLEPVLVPPPDHRRASPAWRPWPPAARSR